MSSWFEDALVAFNAKMGAITAALGDVDYSYYRGLLPPSLDNREINEAMVLGNIPRVMEMLVPAIIFALALSGTRLALQYTVFEPAAYYSMKIKIIPQEADPVIEQEFGKKKSKLVTSTLITSFCAEYKREVADVRSYLSIKFKNQTNKRKVVKFVEAFWRFLFYFVFCVLGGYALFVPETASWVKDTKQHWEQWPVHPISLAMRLWYQVEVGSYIHQLMWTEVTRSDALEMIVHHIATLMLLGISWLTNFTRIGASILLLHDSADGFLELAKMFNYSSKAKGREWAKTCCDVMFGMFAVVFFITRLILYPRYMIFSFFFETAAVFPTRWFGWYLLGALLSTLQALHVFWFYLIAKMIFRLLTTGIEKDERSDDEEEDDLPTADIAATGVNGERELEPVARIHGRVTRKKSKKAE